jgi:hypothetical protein
MNALILLSIAVVLTLLACASLALGLPRNWKLVTGEALAEPVQTIVRRTGWTALFMALLTCVLRDGAGFAVLIWPLLFALAAFVTAMALSFRPVVLRSLARAYQSVAAMKLR